MAGVQSSNMLERLSSLWSVHRAHNVLRRTESVTTFGGKPASNLIKSDVNTVTKNSYAQVRYYIIVFLPCLYQSLCSYRRRVSKIRPTYPKPELGADLGHNASEFNATFTISRSVDVAHARYIESLEI